MRMKGLEARGGIEPPIEVLQTSALPLGDRALGGQLCGTPSLAKLGAGARAVRMERETGFEPATSTLARSHSTTELLPLSKMNYSECAKRRANGVSLAPLRNSFCDLLRVRARLQSCR